MRVKVLLAEARAAAAYGPSGSLRFSRLNAAWELAALKHPTPVSLIRCDARHALRLGQVKQKLNGNVGYSNALKKRYSRHSNQGGIVVINRIALLLVVVLLSACSTTSRVHQAHAGFQGQSFEYQFTNRGGDNAEGIAELSRVVQNQLQSSGFINNGAASGRIEITLTHYYMRHGAARALVGIMAGRDKIVSHVRVLDAS